MESQIIEICEAASTEGASASAIVGLLSSVKIKDLSSKSITTCLKLASSSDSPELLCLLKCHWPTWKNERDGKTVLHLVAEANATECIEALFDDPLPINASVLDGNGLCPAHLMADKSCSLEGFALILEKMANVDLMTKAHKTSLHLASLANRVENVEILLECGASVEVQDNQKMTPLHCAAVGGSGAVAKILCKAGSSIKVKDSTGATPFVLAIRQSSLEVAKELLKHGIGVNDPVTSNRDYPLHIATESRESSMLAMILKEGARIEARNKKGKTALAKLASNGGCVKLINTLLVHGAESRALDKNGKSALYCAVENENYKFITTIKDHLGDDNEFLKASLTSSESTALFAAVEEDDHHAIYSLLVPSDYDEDEDYELGGRNRPLLEWNSPQHGGRSALSQAMFDLKLTAAVNLIRLGADPCLHDRTGFTPLHYFMTNENFCDDLGTVMRCKPLANVNVTDSNLGCTPYSLGVLSAMKAKSLFFMLTAKLIDYNAQDKDGNTSLHFAAMLGRVDIVERLLTYPGVDPNVKNKDGCTPMHSVFSKNNQHLKKYISVFKNTLGLEDLAKRLEETSEAMRRATRQKFFGYTNADEANAKKRLAILKLLVKAGGDVMAKDNRQQTLLHLCAFGSHDNDVEAEFLMDQMPNGGRAVVKNAYDWCGYLPLHTAADSGNIGCATLFIARGAKIKVR